MDKQLQTVILILSEPGEPPDIQVTLKSSIKIIANE
jgi:hypothetical protein